MPQCAIYTKYGKGPRCPKKAKEGSDTCGTHQMLEKKLGPLPRVPANAPDARVGVPASVAPAPVPEQPAEPAAPAPTEPVKPKKERHKKKEGLIARLANSIHSLL